MVLEKKILKGFHIYGHGGHLGHVISIMLLNLNFLAPKTLHTKIGYIQNDPLVSEKSQF